MPVDPRRQAQDLVRDGTHLEANALLLHTLHDVRVPGEREPMPYPLGLEQQSVQEILVRFRARLEGFAAVKQKRDFDLCLLTVPLKFKKLRDKFLEWFGLGFFADEIES